MVAQLRRSNRRTAGTFVPTSRREYSRGQKHWAWQCLCFISLCLLICVAWTPGALGQVRSAAIAIDYQDNNPATGGTTSLVAAWNKAVQANGTPDQQAAFNTSIYSTYDHIVSLDAVYFITSTSAEYYNNVAALYQDNQGIKWQFYGDLLLTSVQSSGTTVTIAGGQYILGIYPATHTFTL